jgi:ribosome-binding factor A
VPILKFVNDDSVKRGAAMDDLIRKAVSSDKHLDDNEQEEQS